MLTTNGKSEFFPSLGAWERETRKFHAYSDADIAVLLQGPPGKFLAVKLEMADIAYDVLLETGIRIQACNTATWTAHVTALITP